MSGVLHRAYAALWVVVVISSAAWLCWVPAFIVWLLWETAPLNLQTFAYTPCWPGKTVGDYTIVRCADLAWWQSYIGISGQPYTIKNNSINLQFPVGPPLQLSDFWITLAIGLLPYIAMITLRWIATGRWQLGPWSRPTVRPSC